MCTYTSFDLCECERGAYIDETHFKNAELLLAFI